MNLIPIELEEANLFVKQFHRHHKTVQGHRFSIAAERDGKIVLESKSRPRIDKHPLQGKLIWEKVGFDPVYHSAGSRNAEGKLGGDVKLKHSQSCSCPICHNEWKRFQ